MIFIPEQKLKSLIDFALSKIDEQYLYRLFGGMKMMDYNYFENAKELFLSRIDSPRKIRSNIFFNKDRQGLPTVHISLNSEQPGEGNGLGFDSEDITNDSQLGEGSLIETTTRSYSSRYNIIFTSNNTFEVLIMYHTIKAFIQGNYSLFELNGLKNLKFSGHDVVLQDYMMPVDIYSRGFIIDCIYEFIAPSIVEIDPVRNIYFNVNCS